jgi:hypothetical protein
MKVSSFRLPTTTVQSSNPRRHPLSPLHLQKNLHNIRYCTCKQNLHKNKRNTPNYIEMCVCICACICVQSIGRLVHAQVPTFWLFERSTIAGKSFPDALQKEMKRMKKRRRACPDMYVSSSKSGSRFVLRRIALNLPFYVFCFPELL